MSEATSTQVQEPRVLPLYPDVAQILGVSRCAIYAAAARGELPTLKVGRRILVPKAALDRFLDSAQVAPKA